MSRIRGSSLLVLFLMATVPPFCTDAYCATTTPITLPTDFTEMTVGSDGNIWMITLKGKIGQLTPGGTFTEFPLPWGLDPFGIPYAQNLTSGIDGNLWVIGFNGHIARVTMSGVATDFAVAPSFYSPPLIVSGADGALWFFDRPAPAPGVSNAWKMGRIDIYGQVTTYDIGISNDQLSGLVSGGDGSLWFIDETKSQVVKFSLITKSVAGVFSIPSPSNQNGDDRTVLAWDGNVWFTRGKSVDRVRPDGAITEFPVPSGGQPAAIVMSGDGNIWFTEPSTGKLGQVLLASMTQGGSAAITETDAQLNDVYELFMWPSAFATAFSTAHLRASSDSCSVTVAAPNSIKRTCSTVTEPLPAPCPAFFEQIVDNVNESGGVIEAILVFGGGASVGPAPSLPLMSGSEVRDSAQAATSTTTINLSAGTGATISKVSTTDPSATVAFSGLAATVTTSSSSETITVTVALPNGAQPASIAGAAVLAAADPDPRQHVASFFLDGSALKNRASLPSNPPLIVITPVKRGR